MMMIFECTETTESTPVKEDASFKVILPPLVSVLRPERKILSSSYQNGLLLPRHRRQDPV